MDSNTAESDVVDSNTAESDVVDSKVVVEETSVTGEVTSSVESADVVAVAVVLVQLNEIIVTYRIVMN